jgi:hypothetical protein
MGGDFPVGFHFPWFTNHAHRLGTSFAPRFAQRHFAACYFQPAEPGSGRANRSPRAIATKATASERAISFSAAVLSPKRTSV